MLLKSHIAIILIILSALIAACQQAQLIDDKAGVVASRATIDPDYMDIVLPPNIAPLNFRIQENGERFLVRLSGNDAKPIIVTSRNGDIRFPLKKWRHFLFIHRGQDIRYDIYIKKSGQWCKYESFSNRVADETIDSHLVYRLINPAFKYWTKMGIYQRNLQSFEEKAIITNKMTDGNCMNCHNFCANDPDNMVFHMRVGAGSGTYISVDGKWSKVNLKTEFNAGGAYPSWHPNGKKIAFSVNSLTMFYHSVGESRDVLDRTSDLFVYDVETNVISTAPPIADINRMETFPAWSADGRHLYFCAAQPLEEYIDEQTQDLSYDHIRYDLMRADYDIESDEWGHAEVIVPAQKTTASAILPRPSPDGKYVLFTMARYGSFPIYHDHSDLYLFDIASGEYRRLTINSDETDSFHSWSSNSRWFVFTSKRRDGLLGRPFFAYIDQNGDVHKPFLLPQKDPEFYATFIINYNVPELVNGPVDVTAHELVRIANDQNHTRRARLDPRVSPRPQRDNEEIDALYKARPKG
ncbi:PD40 domain-containing protein [candidate division KSB1 bacterium]|nr:PD40 domain-containing protein [candidate division KSB1 bacterium]